MFILDQYCESRHAIYIQPNQGVIEMNSRFALVFAAILLTACEQPPAWTREQAESITTRLYPNATPEAVLQQAENVLRLASRETTFAYGDTGFLATRPFSAFMVIAAASGTYQFQVSAKLEGTGTRLRVNTFANSSTSSGIAVPTTYGAAIIPTSTPGAVGQLMQHAAGYEMLFLRVSYLLRQSDVWLDCKTGPKALGATQVPELCLSADDRLPPPR